MKEQIKIPILIILFLSIFLQANAMSSTIPYKFTYLADDRIVCSSNTYSTQYHITDHLGSVRAVLNQNMTVLEQNDYYPFGLRHPNASLKTTANRYRYNGKEEISTTGTSDYGARQYGAEFCQWMQVDPMAEKYYSWSPYNFCVGNPQKYIDPNGREIWIHNGLGDLQYIDGALYNNDGSIFEGKITKYCQKVISAISELNKTEEGKSLVTELQNSNNIFTIKNSSKNEFKASSAKKSSGMILEVIEERNGYAFEGGSGGTIFWNPHSYNGGIDEKNNTSRNPFIGLGHEMVHASDANKGLLYPDQYEVKGLLKSEWRAVFRENKIREQMKIPLRKFYFKDNYGNGLPPQLLDSNGKPIEMSLHPFFLLLLLLICNGTMAQNWIKTKKYEGFVFPESNFFIDICKPTIALSNKEIDYSEAIMQAYVKHLSWKSRKQISLKNKIRQYFAQNIEGEKIVTIRMYNRELIDDLEQFSSEIIVICDGGCDVITVKINLTTKQVISFRCNGEA